MAYNPTLLLTYDGQTIEPAPQISVTKTPTYAGADENVIGYTYTITLSGYASSHLHSKINNVSNTPSSLDSLSAIQNILERNGRTFRIYDTCKNQDYMVALGGKLVSFNVEQGNWYNYVKYNATLEFSELSFYSNFYGYSIGIANDTVSVQDNIMANMLLKLKQYNDAWNFTVPEQEAYMYYTRIAYVDDSGTPAYSAEDYSQIQVSYTISATGKHYYDQLNTTKAAWEYAKEFVQYKLYHQILMFRNGGLLSETPFVNVSYDSSDIGNSANQAISSSAAFQAVPVVPPILDRSIINRYSVYNETIDCEVSETEGTFSATYNCVIKRYDPYLAIPQNSVHEFSVSYNQENSPDSQNRTITVNGSLQGMLRTNILANFNDGQTFVLPANGRFYAIGNDTVTKFGNAYEDFVNYMVNPQIDDLSDGFKYILGINYSNLFPATDQSVPCVWNYGVNFLYQILASPKSFNVTHNYSQGSLEYSATYDTERACAQSRGFNSMTITEDDAVPLYAEHTVVGRTRGTLIQNLNTNKHKTITIAFEGVTNKTCAAGNPFSIGPGDLADPNFNGLALNVCDTEAYTSLPWTVRAIYAWTEWGARLLGKPMIVRSFNTDYNPADGSYSVSKTYTVIPKMPNNNVC